MQIFSTDRWTYDGAETVSWSKVEAALLVHGVLEARQLRLSRPVVVERVVTETVVRAADTQTELSASG